MAGPQWGLRRENSGALEGTRYQAVTPAQTGQQTQDRPSPGVSSCPEQASHFGSLDLWGPCPLSWALRVPRGHPDPAHSSPAVPA